MDQGQENHGFAVGIVFSNLMRDLPEIRFQGCADFAGVVIAVAHADFADIQLQRDHLKDTFDGLDEVLQEALSAIEVKVELPEVQLPKITLAYMETPDQSLLPLADEILNALLELSRKILKFIKQNNIYGTAYREKPKRTYHPEKDADYIRDLARCKERAEKTLAKKYVVDLLSDGSDELFDMLKTLWYP